MKFEYFKFFFLQYLIEFRVFITTSQTRNDNFMNKKH